MVYYHNKISYNRARDELEDLLYLYFTSCLPKTNIMPTFLFFLTSAGVVPGTSMLNIFTLILGYYYWPDFRCGKEGFYNNYM